MVPHIHLGRAQTEDLAGVCRIADETLSRLAVRIEQLPLTLDRKVIDDLITDVVGDAQGPALSRFLFGIATALRQERPSLDEILSAISRTSQAASNLEPVRQDLGNWANIRTTVERLLRIETLQLAAKAADVSYDFERVYLTARFLTTLRPIFNERRDAIKGAAIVQTLRLEYMTAASDLTNISVALDRTDIEQLKKACEDALRKADITAHEARTVWNKITVMQGENNVMQEQNNE